jgi:hypothetical protein
VDGIDWKAKAESIGQHIGRDQHGLDVDQFAAYILA